MISLKQLAEDVCLSLQDDIAFLGNIPPSILDNVLPKMEHHNFKRIYELNPALGAHFDHIWRNICYEEFPERTRALVTRRGPPSSWAKFYSNLLCEKQQLKKIAMEKAGKAKEKKTIAVLDKRPPSAIASKIVSGGVQKKHPLFQKKKQMYKARVKIRK
ncbi:hypothetical protein P9112_003133 [Eukaryota sp. TZLM1-RC]